MVALQTASRHHVVVHRVLWSGEYHASEIICLVGLRGSSATAMDVSLETRAQGFDRP
jgi:hypothetical protein